jgi:hypothetical protein
MVSKFEHGLAQALGTDCVQMARLLPIMLDYLPRPPIVSLWQAATKASKKRKPIASYAAMHNIDNSKASGTGRATLRRSDNLITSAGMPRVPINSQSCNASQENDTAFD